MNTIDIQTLAKSGPPGLPAASNTGRPPAAWVGEHLGLEAFHQLSASLAGFPYVKIVLDRGVDRSQSVLHVIDSKRYAFHADYIGVELMGLSQEEVLKKVDVLNRTFYFDTDRRYFLGIVALHSSQNAVKANRFFTLETVEVDTMSLADIQFFFESVKRVLDPEIPLFFKPANHFQESQMNKVDARDLPRMFNHELFASSGYVVLNPGTATGRLRVFGSEQAYRKNQPSIEWYDILVMDRVPDDIPRISGVINSQLTTPLSHTNVLATGWQIPNCIQLGVSQEISDLDGQWVRYEVSAKSDRLKLEKLAGPIQVPEEPKWNHTHIQLEEPETANTPIRDIRSLRMSDRFRYGTKAANLGELEHLLLHSSSRILGYYRVPRPPRSNLLGYLSSLLAGHDRLSPADLQRVAWEYLRGNLLIPRGIAVPFSFQQEFLQSSAPIQQQIGKLKMALELGAHEIDSICVRLQQMIRKTKLSDHLRDQIDQQIAENLSGVSSFVVRSSSNAEDLQDFSAAGIYESINHVTSAHRVFESIKEVWASLVSPRSVRLRNEVGISLDDSYMGIIIQEEIQSRHGGVLVTTNPAQGHEDFRNVYINVSAGEVKNVVEGTVLPYQYLYNTVEGGGQTISLGSAKTDLDSDVKARLQKLAICGRLLQSYFAQDYTFAAPIDVEWAMNETGLYILQIRPYSH